MKTYNFHSFGYVGPIESDGDFIRHGMGTGKISHRNEFSNLRRCKRYKSLTPLFLSGLNSQSFKKFVFLSYNC